MGIIEGRRLLNQNSDIAPDVHNILNDFVTMQEDSVETLKKYLLCFIIYFRSSILS